MGRVYNISEATKTRIVSLFKGWKKQQFISDQVHVSQSTVLKVLKEYRRTGKLKNKRSKWGGKLVMTRDERKWKRIAQNNCFKKVSYCHKYCEESGFAVAKSTMRRKFA